MAIKQNNCFIICIALLLWGCAFDYNEEAPNTKKSESIPDTSMLDFRMVTIKNNKPSTEITASKAEIYNGKNLTILEEISFIEYQDNKTITRGTADKAEYFNDTKNATITGNILFLSEKEDLEITGNELIWQDEESIIKSSSKIKIVKGDGSEIEGEDFEAKLKEKTFSFSSEAKGYTP